MVDGDANRSVEDIAVKFGVILGALAGLALATGLILHFGWHQVGDAALAAGGQGLAAIIAIYFVCLLISALAWRMTRAAQMATQYYWLYQLMILSNYFHNLPKQGQSHIALQRKVQVWNYLPQTDQPAPNCSALCL
jgi:hypothetical protein